MEVLIKKCDRAINVDESRVPAHVKAYIAEYGWRQRLNDSIASFKADESDADEMYAHVEGILARFYEGDIRAARVGAPRTAEGLALTKARATVVAAWKRQNPKADLKSFTKKDAFARAYLAKHPELVDIARQELEVSKDLDLDSLEVA
ncbi:MAG TPA: hypothetical protein VH187_05495 [Scandinavium sp.]|uniref:hypothetical protein n=1 Tax=Scandinavium sp. TaxID=2830653 RepID=UPI002E376395|nr:hypothetical protein [Scandinavium sp.]HEX4500615.1 hypothetical protein [Scandinavium sp.]